MKVLHLSTSDLGGGAARGAYWLHKALREQQVDSQMLVADRQSDHATVIHGAAKPWEKLQYQACQYGEDFVLKRYPHRARVIFSHASWGLNPLKRIQHIQPDIVHLHWICQGWLTPEAIGKLRQPLVWTLRDLWPLTGGCHYTAGCHQYGDRCGRCPQLNSSREKDLSRRLWERKARWIRPRRPTFVAVSQWVAECAHTSSLFGDCPIEVVPNCVDTQQFRPLKKSAMRDLLGLPQDKQIILFGAISATHDPRKGFKPLVTALQKIAAAGYGDRVEVIVFGAEQPRHPPNTGLKTTYLGKLSDHLTLAAVYSAADVTVIPSLEDACPKMPIESLACGTPVVCFDSTGLKDIVDTGVNGYRAACFDPEDLAKGLLWVLEDVERQAKLSFYGRDKAERVFSPAVVAQAYTAIYQKVLADADSES